MFERLARQTSLSFTMSCSLLKLMSIGSVMPSNHLILCCPLRLLYVYTHTHTHKNIYIYIYVTNLLCRTAETQHCKSTIRQQKLLFKKICFKKQYLKMSKVGSPDYQRQFFPRKYLLTLKKNLLLEDKTFVQNRNQVFTLVNVIIRLGQQVAFLPYKYSK